VTAAGALRGGGLLRVRRDLHCDAGVETASDIVIGEDALVHGPLRSGKGIRAGGDLHGHAGVAAACGILAGGWLRAGTHLEAGWGIKAGGDVECDGAIRAGEGIEADGTILAGVGYGIYAGLGVRMADWPASARVLAHARPPQLISGHWEVPCTAR
jgi:hypothetical protein